LPPISASARQVLARAQEEARGLRHSYIGTEHILLAVLEGPEGPPRRALEARGVTYGMVRAKVVRMMGIGMEDASGRVADHGVLPFTARGKAAVDLAEREAAAHGQEEFGPEHLLLALIREHGGASVRILLDLDVDVAELRDEVLRVLAGAAGSPRP
jgi:ATP-dependent Clp protease ATP-binding subunit ClpC